MICSQSRMAISAQHGHRAGSPQAAILWGLWRRHRAANIALLAAVPTTALLLHLFSVRLPNLAAAEGGAGGLWPLVFLPLGFSILWVLGLFTHSESDRASGFSGVPRRLFVMPVSTASIVGSLHFAGGAALMAVYLGWNWIVYRPLGLSLPLVLPLLLLLAGLILFQAAVWGLVDFPWVRIVVILMGSFAFFASLSVSFA